ncbi:aminoglycoside 6-adenylyltransferase [Spirosoma lituiforme]
MLLNGSRANSAIFKDEYQDFDVVYVVKALDDFTKNHQWIDAFGETIITQLPDQMVIGETSDTSFSYLMLFSDGNRIDLTLYPINQVQPNHWPDSLTLCWLDKDALFTNLPKATDADYLIGAPTSKEFTDTCNEFWWVSTYVVKGSARQQIPYAKEMMETGVRPMFMKMISWQIGAQNNFSVPFGKSGQFIQQFLGASFYNQVLATYANASLEANWQALIGITELFTALAEAVANQLGFVLNWKEIQQTMLYIKQRYDYHKQSD